MAHWDTPKKQRNNHRKAVAGAIIGGASALYGSSSGTGLQGYKAKSYTDYSAYRQAENVRKNTTKSRGYTISDAIMGKKPPKSKW
jgi:hypothetical protein